MARYSREFKAQAVARVHAGESQLAVAQDLGLRRQTLIDWCERTRTAQDEKLAERVQDLVTIALDQMDKAWLAAIERVLELAPDAEMRDAVGAVKILGEQRALQRGQPTQITAETVAISDDATPEQLRAMADEYRQRRESERVRPPA